MKKFPQIFKGYKLTFNVLMFIHTYICTYVHMFPFFCSHRFAVTVINEVSKATKDGSVNVIGKYAL